MDSKELEIGDQILVHYALYSHHGIYCGDDAVIHMSKETGTVTETTLTAFAEGKPVYIRQVEGCDDPEDIIRRARSRLGIRSYSLFWDNCEHFANWCQTLNAESPQIRQWVARGIKTTSFGVGAGMVGASIRAAAVTKVSVNLARIAASPGSLAKMVTTLGGSSVTIGVGGTALLAFGLGGIVGAFLCLGVLPAIAERTRRRQYTQTEQPPAVPRYELSPSLKRSLARLVELATPSQARDGHSPVDVHGDFSSSLKRAFAQFEATLERLKLLAIPPEALDEHCLA